MNNNKYLILFLIIFLFSILKITKIFNSYTKIITIKKSVNNYKDIFNDNVSFVYSQKSNDDSFYPVSKVIVDNKKVLIFSFDSNIDLKKLIRFSNEKPNKSIDNWYSNISEKNISIAYSTQIKKKIYNLILFSSKKNKNYFVSNDLFIYPYKEKELKIGFKNNKLGIELKNKNSINQKKTVVVYKKYNKIYLMIYYLLDDSGIQPINLLPSSLVRQLKANK